MKKPTLYAPDSIRGITICPARNTVAASALYNEIVAAEVCETLGLATEPRIVTPGISASPMSRETFSSTEKDSYRASSPCTPAGGCCCAPGKERT